MASSFSEDDQHLKNEFFFRKRSAKLRKRFLCVLLILKTEFFKINDDINHVISSYVIL